MPDDETDIQETAAQTTDTGPAGGIGISAEKVVDRMFGSTLWLKGMDFIPTSHGRDFEVLVTDRIAGAASAVEPQGTGVASAAQGATITEGEPSFQANPALATQAIQPVLKSHRLQWFTDYTFELANDIVSAYNERLERRAAYAMALKLCVLAVTGQDTANAGRGFRWDLMQTTGGDNAIRAARNVETATNAGVTTDDVLALIAHVDEGYLNWASEPYAWKNPMQRYPADTVAFVCDRGMLNALAKLELGGEALVKWYMNWPLIQGYPVLVVPGWPALPSAIAGAAGVLGFGAWGCFGLRLVTERTDGSFEDCIRHEVTSTAPDVFDKDMLRHKFVCRADYRILDYNAFSLLNVKS